MIAVSLVLFTIYHFWFIIMKNLNNFIFYIERIFRNNLRRHHFVQRCYRRYEFCWYVDIYNIECWTPRLKRDEFIWDKHYRHWERHKLNFISKYFYLKLRYYSSKTLRKELKTKKNLLTFQNVFVYVQSHCNFEQFFFMLKKYEENI